MALRNRIQSRYPLLPASVTIFLKRRFGQLCGFFILAFGCALAAALWTYHPSDPSWNLATDGAIKNVLAYPGSVAADAFLQVVGVASILGIVGIVAWGIRLMLAKPLRWAFLRIVALIGAVLFLAIVCSLGHPPEKWLLPNSLGGAFGDILLSYGQKFLGKSRISLVGISLIGISASFSLAFLAMGLSLLSIWNALRVFSLSIGKGFIWIQTKVFRSTPRKVRKEKTSFLDSFYSRSPLLDTSDSGTTHLTEFGLQVTDEDRQTHAPFTEEPKPKAPIIWQDRFPTSPQKEVQVEEEYSSGYSEDPELGWEDYELPSLDILDSSTQSTAPMIVPEVLEESADHLKIVLEEFGVRGEIVGVRPGPVVTMYEFKPAAGIKTSRVIGLADDIARSMSALSARIAVIPGRNVIGIELPNPIRETVYLRELLQSESYDRANSSLPLVLGKDIGGQPVIADLTRMPHLLVAGTTGSGKSVAVNTMILSLLFRLPPDRCKFIMIDPKMLELSVYDGIPHLLSPVVTDPKKAVVALKWAVREMENRYRAMSKLGVRNIDGFNARIREARQTGELLVRRVQTGFDPDSGKPIFENQPLDLQALPYIVVVVDEMADLMMVAGKEIEAAVQRLAQMARAAGIHLIMATQRPSVDVITGTIKANFPTRISFQVTSKIDSRTILGEQGAEQLLGQGDMLYMAGGGRITRVHGPFVRDDEVERVVGFLKTQAEPAYVEGLTDDEEDMFGGGDGESSKGDTLYHQAVEVVLREGKASTSFIQRHLQIGYNKAAGIIEQMEKNGVVSPANHVGKREVLR